MLVGTQKRIVDMLASGVQKADVARACGVDPSYISQLASREDVAEILNEATVKIAQQHAKRDSVYNELEDKVADMLGASLPLLALQPMKLLQAARIINGLHRRSEGHSVGEDGRTNHVATLNMPTKIVNKFVVNINNQVIQAGNQELITMPSNKIKDINPKEIKDEDIFVL